MKQILESIKLAYILTLRQIGKIFFILPIKKNRIIFESFSGDGYSCNPKYISMQLKKLYGSKVEIIWGIKDNSTIPNDVISCKYRSFKHFLYRITSQVYVCNFLQAMEFPKRRSQIEIQTWHGGGCYKKIGNQEKTRSTIYAIRRNLQVSETDYFIASSEYFEKEIIRTQLNYKGNVLRIGMPRNDCLLQTPDIDKIKLIRKKADVNETDFVILYAPTWREGFDKYTPLNYSRVQAAAEKRFDKKVQVVFRAHLYGKEKNDNILDLTHYPDMQELLYACDALITDYSSSMWDFSLTGKPCFLYVPDLQRYISQRGFDRDITTWGFPVCEDNDQLYYEIENFNDENFKKMMRQHQHDLKTYENGNATDKIVNLIADICELKG